MNTDELVEVYVNIRSQRDLLKRKYEEDDLQLKNDLKQIEAALLEVCNNVGADSIKTKHGTVMRKLDERYFCQDWEGFYDYVINNNAVQLLERRIHQGNFKEHLKETEGDGLPPGINVMREFGVTVRKASKE